MCEGTGPDITRAIMCGLDDVNEKIRAHVINWLPSKKKFVTILWIFNALLSHACGQNLDYPPSVFTQQPQGGSTVLKDNSKVLLCIANGFPQPVYRWKKDGAFVSQANSTSTTWVIDKLKESDAGEYQCMAANPHGAILSDRVRINVAYIKNFNSVSNREISVNQGHAAIINLPSIDSYPDPSVNWYEGNSILISSNSQRYHITKSNQLVVLETKLTDSDKQFYAMALNTFTGESDSSDQFILKVQDEGSRDADILPEIVIPPQHTTAIQPQDTSVTLECVANARPLNYVSLKWYKVLPGERTELMNDNKYVVSFYRRKLTIRNPGTEDTGVYECEARFDGSVQSISAQANLTIYVAPTFTNPPPVQLNTDFGSSATITCEATGIPTPVITWYRNAGGIDVSSNNRYSMEGTSLQISDLEAEDTGMYQCFATNDAGETNRATYLRVFSSAPTITSPPQNQSVLTGDVARFTCEVSGAPRPDIMWFRALTGDTIEEELPGANSRIQVQDEELVISLSEVEDSGKYMCNATNSKGSTAAEAYLRVRVRTRITLPPQDSLVIKGSKAILYCSVEHDVTITPTWTWYHKEQVIPPSDIRRTIKSDGSLEIKSVRNTDIGTYRCEVTSEGGNGEAEAHITVIELPYPPVISQVALNTEEKRAVDVMWNPGFDGNSEILHFIVEYRLVPPGVQLFPEDGWQVSSDNVAASKRSQTVRNLQPARVYQFRVSAVNGVGEGSASPASEEVEIPQEAPTGPPLDVSGSPRSNSSIRIKWSPPEQTHWNGFLLGYNLRYKPSGYPDSTLSFEEIENLVTLFDLVGLIVFQEYEIAVAAYNAKGVGVYSQYIKVRTKEGIPTAPPTDVVATAETSTAIRIEWNPPDPQQINGINMGYKLMVQKRGVDTDPPSVVTVPSDTSNILGRQSTVLQHLEKFTEYTISVLCYTSVGDGPVSITVSEKTLEDVPDQVGSLRFANILDTSLDVIWTPPEHSNGILTGYTLKYNVKNQPLSLVSKNFEPEVLNYTVSNLVATTQYTFEIYALTSKGAGPSRSADIESGVPPEIPEPPTNVVVTDIKGRSVQVRFTPGFNGHTSISKWIIEAQFQARVRRQASGNGGWFVLAEISDPDADTLQLSGLRPYAKYRLRITAVNVAGESVPSDPTDWFDTLQTAPNVPPSDLDLRVLNETAIKIGWTPLAVEDWNGENRGYLLEARMSELTAWNIKKQVTDQHAVSYVLSGLEEFTTYDVRVAAFNNIGDSPYSEVVNVTTRESVPSAGPQSVQGVAVNSTSILVTWAPVPKMQQNGLIIGYKIRYSTTEASDEVSYKVVESSETVSAHVIGLKKFVEYRLQVLAFTRIGDGTLSTPPIIVKTHEDVPGPPSSVYFPVVNWTSVKVVWSPPTEPNGIIKGYQVSYRQDQETPNNAVVNGGLEDYQREYSVSGLTRDTFYSFEISAKTSIGWGTPAVLKVRTILSRSVPDAPTSPGISNQDIGDRWVIITWQAGSDGYGPIRNFTIQYQQNEGQWNTVSDYVPHTLDAFNVTGLKPNSNYKFKVAASNDVGTSEYSLPSRLIVTLQAAPESAPLNLQVEPKTKTSVLITWEPPPRQAWNGPLLGFRLEYKPVDESQWLSELLTDPTIDQLILTTLQLFESYEFRIMAFNQIGDSPWSPVQVVYIEIVPSAPPQNLIAHTNSSTEIRVSWLPPPEDTHNGKLLGYKIFYQVSGENNSVHTLQVPSTASFSLIQGLNIYTEYNFSILAYNRAGDGPNSTLQVYAWTDEGIPGRPGALKFAVTSLSAVNVSWTPPEQENGVITKYLLSYYQEDTVDGERGSYQVEVTGRLYYFVNSLKERLKYVFSVKARTKVGWGNATEGTVTLGPQIGSPDRPSKPEISEGETSITLQWTTFYDGGSPIQGYIIQARKSEESDWSPLMRMNTPEPEVVVPLGNLVENVEYRFRVIAFNADSISEPSEPSDIYIKEEAGDPFYIQWWFLVIVALTGVIFIIMVIFILCITGRNSKDKYKARRAIEKGTGHNPNLHYFTYPADQINRMPTTILQPSDTTQTFTDPVEGNDEGFATFDTRRSQRRSNRGPPSSRRSDITTLPPYSRTPPRPSPSSVNYSDPDEDRKSFPDSGSDITEKPSEPSDSEVGSQASQSDNEDYPDLAGASGGAPAGARPSSFVSNYVANGDVRNSWKRQAHNKPFNAAYSYTDSEQDSSHYAMSLNGGVIMMNNMAGSRAPLPGFSSFV